MKDRLSSARTFLYKYVLSTFIGLGILLVTIVAFYDFGLLGFPILIVTIPLLSIIFFTQIKAKKVYMDGKNLIVSNFRKTINIPFSEIKEVTEITFLSPRPIFVKFKKETEFGKKIMFLGYSKLFLFFSPHPAANKIRNVIKL